jgi:hypothetical protein
VLLSKAASSRRCSLHFVDDFLGEIGAGLHRFVFGALHVHRCSAVGGDIDLDAAALAFAAAFLALKLPFAFSFTFSFTFAFCLAAASANVARRDTPVPFGFELSSWVIAVSSVDRPRNGREHIGARSRNRGGAGQSEIFRSPATITAFIAAPPTRRAVTAEAREA